MSDVSWVKNLQAKCSAAKYGDGIVVDDVTQRDWAVTELARINKSGVTVSVKPARLDVGNPIDNPNAAKDLLAAIKKMSNPNLKEEN